MVALSRFRHFAGDFHAARFELMVVNMTIAMPSGVTIPDSSLLRTSEVIE
jgi:hypothetical protein